MRPHILTAGLAAVLLLAAGCGGDAAETNGARLASPAAPHTGPVEPAPGGRVHEVDMVTDGEGNYFAPADFEVRRGDVIRWRLRTGVHNARFVPDSNRDKRSLPAESPMLQLPGQTFDVLIDVEPGTYYYHCDPHALIGMVGHVTVVR